MGGVLNLESTVKATRDFLVFTGCAFYTQRTLDPPHRAPASPFARAAGLTFVTITYTGHTLTLRESKVHTRHAHMRLCAASGCAWGPRQPPSAHGRCLLSRTAVSAFLTVLRARSRRSRRRPRSSRCRGARADADAPAPSSGLQSGLGALIWSWRRA